MATAAQITQQLTRAVEIVASRIAVGAINNLRDRTIRDTGWHASRWVGAVGRPNSVATPRSRAGRAAAVSFSQQASSIAILSNYRLTQGSEICIGNDGIYIAELDARDNIAAPAVVDALLISLPGTGLR